MNLAETLDAGTLARPLRGDRAMTAPNRPAACIALTERLPDQDPVSRICIVIGARVDSAPLLVLPLRG